MYAWKDTFAFWLWNHQDTLRADEQIVKSLLKDGDVVVDAGANIGLITLLAWSIVGNRGRVYSFEPHPKTFARLIGNLKLNSYGTLYAECAGIGKEKGKAHMTNHFVADINKIDEAGSIDIKLHSLDEVIPHSLRIQLLKLDIEGYELFALEGGKDTLLRTDTVLIELSEKTFQGYGYSSKDILEKLSQSGFTLYKVERDASCTKIDTDYIPKEKYEDVLATRVMLPETLQKRA
jgi:FkbM family methyltransferase